MLAHKGQHKNEHTFRRAKGTYELEPIYLHYPERIEAYLFLFKIALQIIVLIERTARQNIEERGCGLDDFMPNRYDVRNPTTEYLLSPSSPKNTPPGPFSAHIGLSHPLSI